MSSKEKSKTQVITFAPFLKELNGHEMDYHKSLHRIFEINGWETSTLLSNLFQLSQVPENWKVSLYSPRKWSRRSFFAKSFPRLFNLKKFLKTTRSFFESLHPILSKNKEGKNILFFETFNTFHLYALAAYLLFKPASNLFVWILYRYDSKQLFFKGRNDRKILKWMKKKLPKKHLSLFTDTDVLASELSIFFEEKVHVLPIPHTPEKITAPSCNLKSISLWWPGVPRRPKGLHYIQKMLSFSVPEHVEMTLRLSEKTPDLPQTSQLKIEKVKNQLTREDYLRYFETADVILLPYNAWNYQYSSSGIFIEAIVAKRIPLVSEGLWISNELKKHGLEELIVDFEDPKLLSNILKIISDESIRLKLDTMSESYKAYHNEKNFAQDLLQYLPCS